MIQIVLPMWCEAYPGVAMADKNPAMLASGWILNVKMLLLKMELVQEGKGN